MNGAIASPRLESLYDLPVAAAELRGPPSPNALFPEELKGQEKWAAKRVSEFAAGRQCAHHAMQRLGIEPAPLLSQPDRRPAWPTGVVGSITHCKGYAAAVVAQASSVRSLGLDAEVFDAVAPHLWPRVLNAAEFAWVHSMAESERRIWATVVFSAKESFYKCQFGITGCWLEFSDAHVDVSRVSADPVAFSLVTRSQQVMLQGRGLFVDGTVCTAFAWPIEE
ncbi:MAG: 4'-phosphopantetheinyl transferase superfamily protein [Pseudomonadota bacterium]